MANVVCSIGSNQNNVDMTNVTGSGPYTVTLSASAPAGTAIGDRLTDEGSVQDDYLITGVSGSTLTVEDVFGAGAAPDYSGTNQAAINRAYATLTAWSDDHDSTTLYASGDTAIGEVHDDGDLTHTAWVTLTSEAVNITKAILRPFSGDGHGGVTNGGVRWLPSANGYFVDLGAYYDFDIDEIELDHNGTAVNGKNACVWISGNKFPSSPTVNVTRLMLHDMAGSSTWNKNGIYRYQYQSTNIMNNFVWDWNGTDNDVIGIHVYRTTNNVRVTNNTVHNVSGTGGDLYYGIYFDTADTANHTLKNNLVLTTDGTNYSGTVTNVVTDYNAGDDASGIPGTTVYASLTPGTEIDTTTPDLHLAAGATLRGGSKDGEDLGASPAGIEIDIDGDDRDALAVNWHVGADQALAAGGTAPLAAIKRRQNNSLLRR